MMPASILAGWLPTWAHGVAHPHGSSSSGPGPGTLCASLCPHQFPPAEPQCGGSSGAQLCLSVPWSVCLPAPPPPPRWLRAEPWLSTSAEFVEQGCERLHLVPAGRPCHYACVMGAETRTGKAQQPTEGCAEAGEPVSQPGAPGHPPPSLATPCHILGWVESCSPPSPQPSGVSVLCWS